MDQTGIKPSVSHGGYHMERLLMYIGFWHIANCCMFLRCVFSSDEIIAFSFSFLQIANIPMKTVLNLTIDTVGIVFDISTITEMNDFFSPSIFPQKRR